MDEFEAFEADEDFEMYDRGHGRNPRCGFFEELFDRQFLDFFRFDKVIWAKIKKRATEK